MCSICEGVLVVGTTFTSEQACAQKRQGTRKHPVTDELWRLFPAEIHKLGNGEVVLAQSGG